MKASRQSLFCIVVIAVALLLGWWLYSSLHQQPADLEEVSFRRTTKAPSPVPLRPALLMAYYTHWEDNIPPHRSEFELTAEMGYRGPRPPLTIARQTTGASPEILSWLMEWDRRLQLGEVTSPEEKVRLQSLLAATNLPFDVLFEIGRAANFLETDELACLWYIAALARAEEEFGHLTPSSASAPTVRAALPQMGALRRTNRWAAMEQRYTFEQRAYQPLSPESRRAAMLRAEMLHNQGKSHEAAEAAVAVSALHERAGDLTEDEKGEIHWLCGGMLFYAQRYPGAIEHLRQSVQPGRYHTKDSAAFLVLALIRTKQISEAEVVYRRLGAELSGSIFSGQVDAELSAQIVSDQHGVLEGTDARWK